MCLIQILVLLSLLKEFKWNNCATGKVRIRLIFPKKLCKPYVLVPRNVRQGSLDWPPSIVNHCIHYHPTCAAGTSKTAEILFYFLRIRSPCNRRCGFATENRLRAPVMSDGLSIVKLWLSFSKFSISHKSNLEDWILKQTPRRRPCLMVHQVPSYILESFYGCFEYSLEVRLVNGFLLDFPVRHNSPFRLMQIVLSPYMVLDLIFFTPKPRVKKIIITRVYQNIVL